MVRKLDGGRIRYVWFVIDVLLMVTSGAILVYGLANRNLIEQIIK